MITTSKDLEMDYAFINTPDAEVDQSSGNTVKTYCGIAVKSDDDY